MKTFYSDKYRTNDDRTRLDWLNSFEINVRTPTSLNVTSRRRRRKIDVPDGPGFSIFPDPFATTHSDTLGRQTLPCARDAARGVYNRTRLISFGGDGTILRERRANY